MCLLQLDNVNAYLKSRSLPKELMFRVQSYYRGYYRTHTGFSEAKMLDGMPSALRQEVALHLLSTMVNEYASHCCGVVLMGAAHVARVAAAFPAALASSFSVLLPVSPFGSGALRRDMCISVV